VGVIGVAEFHIYFVTTEKEVVLAANVRYLQHLFLGKEGAGRI
jgi:hypothetical protein